MVSSNVPNLLRDKCAQVQHAPDGQVFVLTIGPSGP